MYLKLNLKYLKSAPDTRLPNHKIINFGYLLVKLC